MRAAAGQTRASGAGWHAAASGRSPPSRRPAWFGQRRLRGQGTPTREPWPGRRRTLGRCRVCGSDDVRSGGRREKGHAHNVAVGRSDAACGQQLVQQVPGMLARRAPCCRGRFTLTWTGARGRARSRAPDIKCGSGQRRVSNGKMSVAQRRHTGCMCRSCDPPTACKKTTTTLPLP